MADQNLEPLVESLTARYGRRFDLQDIDHAADYQGSGRLNLPTAVLRHWGSAADS
jgi:hypothetical protein